MALQTGQNVRIAYKAETTIGVAVTGASGYEFRKNAGGGLQLSRALINSNEVRSDGKTSMGRLGSKSVAGSYSADLSLGTFDPLLEALLRGTWSTATTITQATASLTSITTDATSIVAADGSWLTAGLRVGDVFVLTGQNAANNSKNLNVVAITTLTLSVAETLTVDASADTSFTITRRKKLVQPTSTPVNRSFTFDEYNVDLDLSKVSRGCRISSGRLIGQPDGMVVFEFGIVGIDQEAASSGNSPTLTSPTLTSTTGLCWSDATIRGYGGARAAVTAWEITLDLQGQTLPIIGGSESPDVFLGNAVGTGSFSYALSDLADFSAFTAETEFEFHILLVEPESEPKDGMKVHLPRCKYTSFDDPQGNVGAKIATSQFMFATKGTATGYDDSMIGIYSSAA